MAGLPKNGKKGISLAYVIVAAMVLLILSGVLAGAAARDLRLTSVSTQSRQAYLTVKSAVEFAKGEAYREALAGTLADFSVAPGGDPFRAVEAAAPDGKAVYARCAVGEDGLISVSGKVAYDSGRYRSLGCTFRLTEEEGSGSGIGAINGFIAAGGAYGGNKFMNGEDKFAPDGRSHYPVLLKKSIQVFGSSNSLDAPSVFFLGGRDGGASLDFADSSSKLDIKADFVYITGTVNGAKDGGHQTKRSQFRLPKKWDIGDWDNFIYVWFDDATINLKNVGTKTLNGLYRFPSGADLFDFDSYPPETDGEHWNLYGYYSDMVSYFNEECENIVSGDARNGGIGWTETGHIQTGNPEKVPGQDVFMYADRNGNAYYERWKNQHSPQTFEARSIVLQYNGGNESFKIPDTTITFQVDELWLNSQTIDGPPNMDLSALILQQSDFSSRFVIQSESGDPVTVYLPHGLEVKGKDILGLDQLYSVPHGAYTVESGTDLFSLNWNNYRDYFTRIPWSGGSGGGTGEGGVAVSDLKYTDS